MTDTTDVVSVVPEGPKGMQTCGEKLSDLSLMCIMPFLAWFVTGYAYASVGLHYRENSWAIWHMGVLTFLAYLVRPVVSLIISRVGPWMALPLTCFALLLLLPAVFEPSDEVAVSLQMISAWSFLVDLALQGFCFTRFSDKDALRKASRLQSLSSTTGYGMSHFVGGLVYDLGGWRSCVLLQAAVQGSLIILLLLSPSLWQDWQHWRARRKSASTVETPQKSEKSVQKILLPVLAVAAAQFASSYSYMCEWATFAIYFREVHRWDDAVWAGLAQMAGDIAGGLVLLISASYSSPVEAKADMKSSSRLHSMASKPYHLTLLLGAWCMLNLGMASSLHVAVTCQVLMGSVFVFFMQFVNEMSMFYASGNQEVYLKLQSIQQVAFNCGNALSGIASLLFYNELGPLIPFFVSAAICFCCFLFYTACFLLRIGCSSLESSETGLP